MFAAYESNASFARLEEEVLKFWEEKGVFQQSLDNRRQETPYVFYDGPPFATGLPHYGHLLAGTIKDVVPRYQTMRGRYVERVFGWDCHGLPIEALAQEKLGLAGTPAIIAKGVDVFNEQCRSMVLRYVREWKEIVTRMGRWVDFDHGYKTMDATFMESIWWVFKQLWEQGRVYKAHRIMPYSWKLNTPLSNMEAGSNYQDVQDPAVTLRMKLHQHSLPGAEKLQVYVLVWTTTPWTLPANLSACVGPDIDYCLVRDGESDDAYLMAKARLGAYYKSETEYQIVYECKGRELVGLRYEPLFPYFAEQPNAFQILMDDYVTTTDGTGIVHQAPAFGEDDYRVCKAAGIELVDPLDSDAKFTELAPDFAGMNCKDADKLIIRYLKQAGKLVHQSTIVHSYPFCERTDTPLIYRAIEAWYIRVEDLHERLRRNNRQITWMPDHVGSRRFDNWLGDAKDWNISRNRFWGSCLPIWINEQDPDDMICVGSAAELEELSGEKVTDLHKHFIDKIIIRRDGRTYRRTPEVLDCWFESGAMPYAQHHYPFSNQEKVDATFPADFIAEGLDQTRGWFYSLMLLSTMLFDKPAFRNVIVNGLILAEDGRKMSKRLQNYPDPQHVINEYGADALRLCLLASPVVRGEDLRFSEDAVREMMRTVIIPLWNAHCFLATYARIDQWRPASKVAAPPSAPTNVLDRWVLASLTQVITEVRTHMDNYDLQKAAVRFNAFIDDLTNWYIRRCRRRFWKSANDLDKNDAYQTLHYTLVTLCQVAAPFIPFVTETIYRNLRTEDMPISVHLCDYPEINSEFLDSDLTTCMDRTMSAVTLGRFLRTQAGLKIRQPLATAVLVSANAEVRADLQTMADVVAEELNVKKVEVRADEEELVTLSAMPNLKRLGPKLGQRMKVVIPVINNLKGAEISSLRAGEVLKLHDAAGAELELSEADILVQRTEKAGMTVANEGEITVALDTRLTPVLIQEGWAREVVSKLQNLRKELRFEVTDRIKVTYDLPAEIAAAMLTQAAYVQSETLAVSMVAGQEDSMHEVELNGLTGRFALSVIDQG